VSALSVCTASDSCCIQHLYTAMARPCRSVVVVAAAVACCVSDIKHIVQAHQNCDSVAVLCVPVMQCACSPAYTVNCTALRTTHCMHARLEQAQDGTQAQFNPSKGHVQEECSGVGVCDRKSGSCRCPTVSTCSLVLQTHQAKLLLSTAVSCIDVYYSAAFEHTHTSTALDTAT
jgi:hypothetical protein